jgi:hypothetical protein
VRSTNQIFDVLASDSWTMRTLRRYVLPGFARLMTSFKPVRAVMFPFLAETAISYRGQSLASTTQRGHFTVQPGDRMPYFLIDGTDVFQRLTAPKFHLVMVTDGRQQLGAATTNLHPTFAHWTDVTAVPLNPHLTELFGSDQPFTMLLRPDNYLAAIWPGLDATPAQDWLAALFTE